MILVKKWSLDSSFVISFLSGDEVAGKFLQTGGYDEIVLPSAVKLEVKWGKKDIGKFDELEVKQFGDGEVAEALRIKEFLKDKGKMINKLDIMIAAQAATSNSTLITLDSDFDELEDYSNFEHINIEARNQ